MPLQKTRLWVGRGLIGAVLFLNLQCAAVFIATPERYAPGFELSGVAGAAMVRGMGVLFVMWNVPYCVALIHPVRRRLSLGEAICMQAIGFFGESAIALGIPAGHALVLSTVGRFIAFDGGGLVALLIAWLITWRLDVDPLVAPTHSPGGD